MLDIYEEKDKDGCLKSSLSMYVNSKCWVDICNDMVSTNVQNTTPALFVYFIGHTVKTRP